MAMTIAGSTGLTFNNNSTSTVGGIGDGQSWVAYNTARVSGTTYTNSTGKPIQVCIAFQASGAGSLTIVVGGVTIHQNTSVGYSQGQSFIVPNGSTYVVTYSNVSNFTWAELR